MTAAARKVYFVSLGCPKNRVDSEVMLGAMTEDGHAIVSQPDDADVIVVNTCGFIDAAKEESIDTILEMAQYKTEGACKKLVVAGCLTQRYPDEVAREIPEIDHILGSADYQGISALIAEQAPGDPSAEAPGGKPKRKVKRLPVLKVSDTPAYLYDHTSPRLITGPRFSVYVKIAEGCDRPCAFCIIPKLRGPQRSRTIDSVVQEVQALVKEGAREINLVAQDLTRYGTDLEGKPTLAQMLRRLGQIEDLKWIRLHYTYPTAFTDELIDAIAEEPKVVKYIDVPLQHIDDQMLKLMRRGHTSRITYELIEKLRARIPNVVLRSTFIVGHPGETEERFAALCDFIERAQLDRVGVFTYSAEPGTVSATLGDPVPHAVALERQAHLMELQRQVSRTKNESMIGREIEVLVEGVSDESDLLLQGRWYGQAPEIDGTVYLADGTAQPGTFVRAMVTTSADYDLAASLHLG